MIIDIQYSASRNDWPVLREAVRRAEQDGFDTAWVFDHFDGAMLGGDRPMLEAFTLLGALAEATSTIRLGTLVANVANRHPALLALAASTVERISEGRLILGVGAGSAPGSRWAREHEERGIELVPELAERHRLVARNIAAVRDATDVPIVVGVNSVELAVLAGELADGVNVRMSHRRAAELVDTARRVAGDRPFDVSGWAFLDDANARAHATDLGLDRLVLVDLGDLRGRHA